MQIGNFDLNKDGTLIIAELSANHNGNLQNALDTIKAAKEIGANVIEKHFILDKSIGGVDADFSLDKKEFDEMIKAVRDAEKLLGKVDYSMTEKKKKNRQFSRSLYVAEDIRQGDILTEENVRSVRPGYGLHPKYLNDVLGRSSQKDYKLGDRLDK